MNFFVDCLQVALLLLLLGPEQSYSGPLSIGTPPSFVGQPKDMVVEESFLHDVNGTFVNLMLSCDVAGSPTPTVSWFRGDIDITSQGVLLTNGTIGLNVTEQDGGATRAGILYHCTATNVIGPNNATATIRSRDATVSYAFFGGFSGQGGTVEVQGFVSNPAAVECMVLQSNPPPNIVWSLNGLVISTNAQYLQGGRFLFIPSLSSSDLGLYTCEVINRLIDKTAASSTTYNLQNTLPDGQFRIYNSLDDVVGSVGEEMTLFLIVSYRTSTGVLSVTCSIPDYTTTGTTLFSSAGPRHTFRVPDLSEVGGKTKVEIVCTVLTSDTGTVATERANLTIIRPANITSPPAQSGELVKRNLIAGGKSVIMRCGSDGLPAPSVRWFYNGGPISGSSGASENGVQVTISFPQVTNSGIYQCFVTNGYSRSLADVQRTWIVDITESRSPTFESLVSTNSMAVPDRLEGTLLVSPLYTADLTFRVMVDSNPCPSIQWQFNGSNITDADSRFTFTNPCDSDPDFSPYEFNLTIANLTSETSGSYSALFYHAFSAPSAPSRLPDVFITIPVESMPLRVSLKIVDLPGIACLLAGRTAILTCDIIGYPRPRLEFLEDSVLIDPAQHDRISNISFDQIQLSMIDRLDSGSYSCRMDPVNGNNRVTPGFDFIYCTFPQISNITSTVNVVEGDLLEVVCNINGTPVPMVTWYKDNQQLSQDNNIRISTTPDGLSSIINFLSSSTSNNGIYECSATNAAGSTNKTVQIQVMPKSTALLSTTAIIGVAAGAAGLVLIIVLLVLLLICVFLCARKSSKSADFQPYNVDTTPGDDYKDGRGNVDTDSVEGHLPPEAFDPDYASLPTKRPNEPPPYKAAPGYSHGGPLEGDDLEMVKYPPQDSESFVGYSRQPDQYRPTPDDFLSEDAQFV